MWFADVVVDISWFVARRGKLEEPRARATQDVDDPAVKTEILLYGDDEAIRHFRVMLQTDDHAAAAACVDSNIHRWINALEVSSALTTPNVTTAATLGKNSSTFIVFLGNGDEHSDSYLLDPQYAPVTKADLVSAAQLMVSWKPDFRVHLFDLGRFLNDNLPLEVRWLNGYRLLEWHFRRGRSKLSRDQTYLAFLNKYGAAFDQHLGPQQDRKGLIEEVRALVAHALLSRTTDPRNENASTNLVIKTFAALEMLVTQLMNEGVVEGVVFHPKGQEHVLPSEGGGDPLNVSVGSEAEIQTGDLPTGRNS